MKPQATYAGTIQGDLEGYDIVMSLDDTPEGRAHIISLMTDLYSDQELAIIREYSTNGLDAHIDAGNPDPIEVRTPTALDPHLVIRDRGVGLSVDDLESVYSKIGASTKRGTNLTNGMLGVGGKSALTYTSQFTVRAVKNGVKAQVVVTRGDDGIGVMKVVDTRATDEPNGVEIRIPSNDARGLAEKAKQFFYYWKPGTVLLNGSQPESIFTDSNQRMVNDNVYVSTSRWGGISRSDTDIIVMGNVAYATKGKPFSEILTDNYWAHSTIFVKMGEISFAPSREAVAYTPLTVATIERIKKEITDGVKQSIQAQLTSAKSYQDAFRIWHSWSEIVGVKNLPDMTYNGEKFVNTVRYKHFYCAVGAGRYNWQNNTRGDSYGEDSTIPMQTLMSDSIVIVTGYPNSSAPSGNARKRIKQYIDSLPNTPKRILFCKEVPGAPWTDDVSYVPWSDISAITISTGANGRGGKTGRIPVKMFVDNIWKEQTPEDGYKYLLVSPTYDMSPYRMRYMMQAVPNLRFVLLGANRWDKFIRENPGSIRYTEYVAHHYKDDLEARLTYDERFYVGYDSNYHEIAEYVKNSNDPAFRRLADSTVDTTRISEYTGLVSTEQKQLDKDYPLLSDGYGIVRKHADHMIAYINAIYTKGN